jgi:DNA-binding transcriptional LysR family regulator
MDDMGLFALVAELGSFTAAAARAGIPKQTLSRRVAMLERALGMRLLHRTTRRVRTTEAGARYARRCAELAALAVEANREIRDADETPKGTLRLTADPVFGEAFVTSVVVEYARRFPEVAVEVMLTRRRVDLVPRSARRASRWRRRACARGWASASFPASPRPRTSARARSSPCSSPTRCRSGRCGSSIPRARSSRRGSARSSTSRR